MVCGLSNGTTVSDLEGHFPVAGSFTCNPSNILQYFTRFQPTARSRGPSATAGLLVYGAFTQKILFGYILVFGFACEKLTDDLNDLCSWLTERVFGRNGIYGL